MRKIGILLLIIFSLGFYLIHSTAAEKIDLKLDNQIGIVFLNQNMLLILSGDEATLLVLNKDKLNNLNKFYYRNLNVITLNNNLVNIKSKEKVILEDVYEKENVTYSIKDGTIYINYKNTNMCIYMEGDPNFRSCQFIYFYNTNISRLDVCEYNEIVLYHYKKTLPYRIMENIYEQAIDAYQLRDDELTIIKLSEDDYDFIVINNE